MKITIIRDLNRDTDFESTCRFLYDSPSYEKIKTLGLIEDMRRRNFNFLNFNNSFYDLEEGYFYLDWEADYKFRTGLDWDWNNIPKDYEILVDDENNLDLYNVIAESESSFDYYEEDREVKLKKRENLLC